MNDNTFVKYMKEIYPRMYESLVEDFEKAIRRKAVETKRFKKK